MRHHRNRPYALAFAAALAVSATLAPRAQADIVLTLGSAANFSMFADGVQGSGQSADIDLNTATINGNLGAPSIFGVAANHYNGNVFTGDANQPPGTLTGTYFPNSTTVIANAQADATTFSNQVAALAPTQTISGITTTGVTIAGHGGNNIIDVNGSITQGFKVSGGANDIFVFNVTGTMDVNSGIIADITATGVTANHILFYFIGSGPTQTVTTMTPDVLNGTLLSTNGNYRFALASLAANGAAIDMFNGETAILGLSGLSQNGPGNIFTGITVVPEPSTTALGLVAAVFGLGYARFRRKNATPAA